MKHRTSELTGALLDAAVAKAEGFTSFWIDPGDESRDEACVLGPSRAEDARFDWSPSTAWEQGGPIIECEEMNLGPDVQTVDGVATSVWVASAYNGDNEQIGLTPLIAAMRAYVASKLGEEIDLG